MSYIQKCSDLKIQLQNAKSELANKVFELADSGNITKACAVEVLSDYDALPIDDWINLPHILENYDYFNKYQTIKYKNYLYEDDFGGPYTAYPGVTYEEAMDELYKFIKDNRVIGCIYDW